jgi:DNA-binding XRE family transcriptional regulator
MPRSGPSPHAHGRSELRERADLKLAVEAEQGRLGSRLRRLRLGRGLTQETAAERIGLHPKHLSRIEAGTVNVTFATLVAISKAYEKRLKALF